MHDLIEEIEKKLASDLLIIKKLQYAYNIRDYGECTKIINSDNVLLERFTKVAISAKYKGRQITDKIDWIVKAIEPDDMNSIVTTFFHNQRYFKNLHQNAFNFSRYKIYGILTSKIAHGFFDAVPSIREPLSSEAITEIGKGYSVSYLPFDIYLISMIRDIGKLLIGEVFPEIFTKIEEYFRYRISDHKAINRMESQLLKEVLNNNEEEYIDHCWFAKEILKKMGYHILFQDAVLNHHKEENHPTKLSEYLAVCDSLIVREPFDETDEENALVAKVDTDSLNRFLDKYSLGEEEFHRILFGVETFMNSISGYLNIQNCKKSAQGFRIMDEPQTDKLYRKLNNLIVSFLDSQDAPDQIIVINKLVRRFDMRMRDSYKVVHYFSFDIKGSSLIAQKNIDVVAEKIMQTFHRFIKQILEKHFHNAYHLIKAEGDSYIVQLSYINNALMLCNIIEKSKVILSHKTGIPFEFYYHIHSGHESKFLTLDKGEKKSLVLDALGHFSDEFKIPNKLIISAASYNFLNDDDKERFDLYKISSKEKIQTYITKE
jgi:hypothetical protein